MSTSHFQAYTCSTNKDKHFIMCCFNDGISLSIHGKYIKQNQTKHTRCGCLFCFNTPKLNKLNKQIKYINNICNTCHVDVVAGSLYILSTKHTHF